MSQKVTLFSLPLRKLIEQTAMNKKTVAVILAGCGNMDGNNIQEAILLLTSIALEGAAYQCFAPDVEQHHVVDHYTGNEMPERRYVLHEAARMVQGDVKPLSDFKADDFDALVFPGGYGVVKNLCTYAIAGVNATVNSEVKEVILAMHNAKKPIGAMCIAPILISLVLRKGIITLGASCDASKDAEALGMTHKETKQDEFVEDRENLIFTTPCFMLPNDLVHVLKGTSGMVKALLSHCK